MKKNITQVRSKKPIRFIFCGILFFIPAAFWLKVGEFIMGEKVTYRNESRDEALVEEIENIKAKRGTKIIWPEGTVKIENATRESILLIGYNQALSEVIEIIKK